MQFETYKLQPPHQQYIESIFHFSGFMPDHSIERLVPTGHIFLLFELDNFVRHTYDNETLKEIDSLSGSWVSGMHTNYISISAHPDSEMFVIQFKPYGAYSYFHFPIYRLNEKIVPAEKLFKIDITRLREEIRIQKTSKDKFRVAETWLNTRFDPSKTAPDALVEVLEKLHKEPAVKYKNIVASYPNTHKHLIGQFKKMIGLTPKQYQRIVRFNEIFNQLNNNDKIVWSQIAYQCGFSDQSHFIKEFRHFSGFNPQEFIKQDFDLTEPNFFPLDRKG